MNKRVLIAGNDLTFFQAIRGYMLGENIDVSHAESVANAVESTLKQDFSLIIIAIRPSEREDVELLRIIRESQKMPIIILADKMTTADKVALFQAGANVCMERPVDLSVCTAQASSLIRLYSEAKEENRAYLPLNFGSELIIDTTYRQAIVDGEPLDLTCKEFELLVCLAKHPCQVWSRTQLYRYVWNDTLGLNGDNTVKTHIGNLKKKLTGLGKDYIQNSRGVGYRFVPPGDCLKA